MVVQRSITIADLDHSHPKDTNTCKYRRGEYERIPGEPKDRPSYGIKMMGQL